MNMHITINYFKLLLFDSPTRFRILGIWLHCFSFGTRGRYPLSSIIFLYFKEIFLSVTSNLMKLSLAINEPHQWMLPESLFLTQQKIRSSSSHDHIFCLISSQNKEEELMNTYKVKASRNFWCSSSVQFSRCLVMVYGFRDFCDGGVAEEVGDWGGLILKLFMCCLCYGMIAVLWFAGICLICFTWRLCGLLRAPFIFGREKLQTAKNCHTQKFA